MKTEAQLLSWRRKQDEEARRENKRLRALVEKRLHVVIPARFKEAAIASVLLLLSGLWLGAASPIPILIWDENTETNLAGYTVYIGGSSRSYTNAVQTTNTMHSLSCMPAGTYFFAVTARNTNGLESAFSEELKWTTVTNTPCPPSAPGLPRVIYTLQSAGDPAGPWRVEGSEIVVANATNRFFRTALVVER